MRPKDQCLSEITFGIHSIYTALCSSQGATLTVGTKDDFKWATSTANTTSHRAYLDSATDLSVQHQFWNPRIEQVDDPLAPVDVLFVSPAASPQSVSLTGNGRPTIQARSVSATGVPSAVATATYTFKAATPTASATVVSGGSSVQLTLATATTRSTIRYTVNGTDPLPSSTLYSAPFTTAAANLVKFKAFRSGYLDSDIGSYQGTIDSDYDGRNNVQELVDGTNPNDPASFSPVMLAQWKFELASLVGEGGQLPMNQQNVTRVASLYGNALSHSAAGTGLLQYKELESSGAANINLRNGTIRFLFRPSWGSTNDFNVGPGVEGRLVTVGQNSPGATSGEWSLAVTPDSSHLFLRTQANGVNTTNLFCPISWAPGQWHEVTLTYDSTATKVFIDGDPAGAGTGIVNIPAADVRDDGFWIGSDHLGQQKAFGEFDSFETYNYVRTPGNIVTAFSVTLPAVANQAPVVKAVESFIVAQPGQPVTLVWNASDDSPVAPYGYVFTTPQGATIEQVAPSVNQWIITYITSFAQPGTYRANVGLSDATGFGRDRITIVVPQPGANTPPIVYLRPGPLHYASCFQLLLFAHPDPDSGTWVRDIDSAVLAGGYMELWCQTGEWTASDKLSFAPWDSSFVFDSATGKILDHTVEVGTVSGSGANGNPFRITFTSATTANHVSRMLLFMTYRNISAGQSSGERQLNLRVSDGVSLSETKSLQINVIPDLPSLAVNAGPPQEVALPCTGGSVSVALVGLVNGEAMLGGSCRSITWSKIAGPGTVDFAPANSSAASATFAQSGTYTLRLSVTSGALSAYSDVEVKVNDDGQIAPRVDIEPEYQSITLGASPTFNAPIIQGQCPGETFAKLWQSVGGPAQPVIPAPSADNPGSITFPQPGLYTLRFSATRTGGNPNIFGSDTATVEVKPNDTANQPPKVYAGSDQSVQKDIGALLEGIVSDDGLPSTSALSVLWKDSNDGNDGPPGGVVQFGDASSASTRATFNVPGLYRLVLTANDGTGTVFDDVYIRVYANQRIARDVVFVLDKSILINEGDLPYAHDLASGIAQFLDPGVGRAGLVVFAFNAWLQQPLTYDIEQLRRATRPPSPLGKLSQGDCRISAGLRLASMELTGPRKSATADRIIILMSRGRGGLEADAVERPLAMKELRAAGIWVIPVGIYPDDKPEPNTLARTASESLLMELSSEANYLPQLKPLLNDQLPTMLTKMWSDFRSISEKLTVHGNFDKRRLFVNAGSDVTIRPGSGPVSVDLHGTAQAGLAPLNYMWTKQSGPAGGNCSFTSPTAGTTAASFSGEEGTYLLRLTVTDSGPPAVSDFDDIVVRVTSAPVGDYVWVPKGSNRNKIDLLANDPNDGAPRTIDQFHLEQYRYPGSSWRLLDENGQEAASGNGKFLEYIPEGELEGIPQVFTYQMLRNGVDAGETNVWIMTDVVNEPPVAMDDDNPTAFYFAPDNQSHPLNDVDIHPNNPDITTNDKDVNLGEQYSPSTDYSDTWTMYPFVITSVTQPVKDEGTHTSGADYGYVYLAEDMQRINRIYYRTPSDPQFDGSVTFTYTIRDTLGATSTAKVRIYVYPTAGLTRYKAADDFKIISTATTAPVEINVLANDKDVAGQTPTTFALLPLPSQDSGTVGGIGNAQDGYTMLTLTPGSSPVPGSFTYRLFDVNPENPAHLGTVYVGFRSDSHNNPPSGALSEIDGKTFDSAGTPPVVRRGFVKVKGSAAGPDTLNLVRYRLQAWTFDDDYPVAEVTSTGPVTAGNLLGTLDLREVRDGMYRLRLTVSINCDQSGEVLETPAGSSVDYWEYFMLDSGFRLGQLELQVKDFEIPLEGMSLEVSRLYQGPDSVGGDFGAAWRMNVGGATLAKSVSLGSAWKPGPGNCVVNSPRQMVWIRFNSGEVYSFSPRVQCQPGGDIHGGIQLDPLPSTSGATLKILPDPQPTLIVQADVDGLMKLETADANAFYDPDEFLFTHPNGTKYWFKNGVIVRIEDRNANSLILNRESFPMTLQYEKAGGTSVKKIFMDREANNASGKVTKVYFENEGATPLVKYEYSGPGNAYLTKVHRLMDKQDPTNPKYSTASYEYLIEKASLLGHSTAANDPELHFLTKIDDSVGPVARYEYDKKGRLSASVDGVGTKASFDYHDELAPEQMLAAGFGEMGRQTIRDNFGNETIHEYDAHGNIVLTRDPLNNDTKNEYTYDASDRIQTETTTKYKGKFNVATPVVLEGPVTRAFTYHGTSDTVESIVVSGTTSGSQWFDSYGNLLSSTDAMNRTTSYEYVDGNEPPPPLNTPPNYVNGKRHAKSLLTLDRHLLGRS